jgi:o-succinylbenzoate synthase
MNGQIRSGVIVKITDEKGHHGYGDIAPLPKRSRETLDESVQQLEKKRQEIMQIDGSAHDWLQEMAKLQLFPSVLFGLESALLAILIPLKAFKVPVSAFLMGSSQEILEQAKLKYIEGFTSAKLKVSQLTFEEAAWTIHQLKDKFRLRIDVNGAWETEESLRFFSQFPLDTFDYVEEPFKNPHDLDRFPHPLAVDESFPHSLSLEILASLPSLKALIYKPTLQGGLLGSLPLKAWTAERGINIVLSSSFESDLGHAQVASIAYRLGLQTPVGIGTYHYLNKHLCAHPWQFYGSFAHIPADLSLKHSPLEA